MKRLRELWPTITVDKRLLMKLWTLLLLFLINLMGYFDRATIAGILPELQDETRNGFDKPVNDTMAGLLQTVFIVSYMLFAPLFGYLGDRFTRKYIMAAGIFFGTCFILISSFSVNYVMLVVTRSLVGVGEAAYVTVSPTVIGDLFSAEKRVRALSVLFLAIPIGSALGFEIGSLVSSLIYRQFGYRESWRWALRIAPALGIVAVILILFTVREPQRGESDDSGKKSGVKGKLGPKHYLADIIYLLRNRTYILTSFGFATLVFVIGALFQWAATLVYRVSRLQNADDLSKAYSVSQASLGFGIVTMTAGVVGIIVGSELSKLIHRWTNEADSIICSIGAMVAGPCIYLGLAFGTLNLTVAWVFVFFGTLSFSILWAPVAAILLYVVVPERRSTAMALHMLIIHVLGDASSPFIVGAVSDAIYGTLIQNYDNIYSQAISLNYSLYMCTFICVIGGGLFLWSTFTVVSDREAVKAHVKRTDDTNITHNDSTSLNTFSSDPKQTTEQVDKSESDLGH